MTIELSYGDNIHDENWGAVFAEVKQSKNIDNIFVCHISVSDLSKIANELSKTVMDKSWIVDLDIAAKRAYETIAAKTAEKLVKLFESNIDPEDKISADFGEIMVSIGAARALETIFSHISIPIAELWKPKLIGNEGFDFHTICPAKMINFGEAKFSSSSSPYGGNSGDSKGAGGQADGFINSQKHLMDGVHLPHLAGQEAADNLNNDLFGVVLAFSINAENPLTVFKNAIQKALEYTHLKKAKNIYIVGVSHASP